MGEHLRQAGVGSAVFLACGIGASRGFMRLISTEWRITVAGYPDGVASVVDTATNWTAPRTRLYLWRDGVMPGSTLGVGSSATPRSWLEMPPRLMTYP